MDKIIIRLKVIKYKKNSFIIYLSKLFIRLYHLAQLFKLKFIFRIYLINHVIELCHPFDTKLYC